MADASTEAGSGGPLKAVRVLQLAGLGPVAFCGQVLSDLGADVIRVDPPVPHIDAGYNARGRRSAVIDLKSLEGLEAALALAGRADVLIEGFRPGVAERLGIGPEACLERNDMLVYGRCSGWGREGPLAGDAGHDLSYLALAGTLSMLGTPGQPPPPLLGLLGDRGGGGMTLAVGILSALVERSASHRGQVVDTSILDGALLLTGAYYEALAKGHRSDAQWSQGTDGSAPFYSVYTTKDGRYVAVAAVEPQFYAALLSLLGLDRDALPSQNDRSSWPAVKELFAARIRSRTRDEWAGLAEGTDACLTPVLTLSEAPRHPHHLQRGSFISLRGTAQPDPCRGSAGHRPPIRRRRPAKASTRPARFATGASASWKSRCSWPAVPSSRMPASRPPCGGRLAAGTGRRHPGPARAGRISPAPAGHGHSRSG